MRQKVFNWGAAAAIAAIVLREVFQYGVLTKTVNDLEVTVGEIKEQVSQLQTTR